MILIFKFNCFYFTNIDLQAKYAHGDIKPGNIMWSGQVSQYLDQNTIIYFDTTYSLLEDTTYSLLEESTVSHNKQGN